MVITNDMWYSGNAMKESLLELVHGAEAIEVCYDVCTYDSVCVGRLILVDCSLRGDKETLLSLSTLKFEVNASIP